MSLTIGTALVVGVGVWTMRLLGPIPLTVNQTVTQKQTTFDVTGKSNIVTIPDEARVQLGIDVTESTVARAQERANQTINNISQALQDLGIPKKDIRTQNYSIYPDYDYANTGRRILGYRVNTQLQVTLTDFEKLNQVIDQATALGSNQVGGVSFSLSEQKEQELTKQARQEAIEDAKKDAQELAGLAEIKLGRVINVYENQMSDVQPLYRAAVLETSDTDAIQAPTQIEPGSQEFNYQVTLSYETL